MKSKKSVKFAKKPVAIAIDRLPTPVIAKDAAKDFIESDCSKFATDAKIKGAGICFISPNGDALFLKRCKDANNGHTWDFPGGKTDGDETPEQTARRESMEEIGAMPYGMLEPFSHTRDLEPLQDDDVEYITYKMRIIRKFEPKLQMDEHIDYIWAPLNNPPQPLHPGVEATLTKFALDYVVGGEGFAREYPSPIANTKVTREPVENTVVHASSPNYAKGGTTEPGTHPSSATTEPTVSKHASDSAMAFDKHPINMFEGVI